VYTPRFHKMFKEIWLKVKERSWTSLGQYVYDHWCYLFSLTPKWMDTFCIKRAAVCSYIGSLRAPAAPFVCTLRVHGHERLHGRRPHVASPGGGSHPVFCPVRFRGRCRLRLQRSSLCCLSTYRSVCCDPDLSESNLLLLESFNVLFFVA